MNGSASEHPFFETKLSDDCVARVLANENHHDPMTLLQDLWKSCKKNRRDVRFLSFDWLLKIVDSRLRQYVSRFLANKYRGRAVGETICFSRSGIFVVSQATMERGRRKKTKYFCKRVPTSILFERNKEQYWCRLVLLCPKAIRSRSVWSGWIRRERCQR